jgi:pSer/pThr/pTyr-binding forkhead associated (FHA) protein
MIVRDGYQIGRGSACDLRLPDHAISRQHARIRYAQGGWFLQDMDSTGGTFVNGQRVGATRLNPGDSIQIGSATFTFGSEDPHA